MPIDINEVIPVVHDAIETNQPNLLQRVKYLGHLAKLIRDIRGHADGQAVWHACCHCVNSDLEVEPVRLLLQRRDSEAATPHLHVRRSMSGPEAAR